MRCTLVWLMPIAFAIVRTLQCVAFAGRSFAVLAITLSRPLGRAAAYPVAGSCRAASLRCRPRIAFLKQIDRTAAKHLDLHLIVDNYGTHKTAEVQAWLAKHSRFKLHFIPTSSSRFNLVERFSAQHFRQRRRTGGSNPRLPRPPQRRS